MTTNESGTLRVIWIALTMSVVLYGVIAFAAVPTGEQSFEAAFSSQPVILLLHILGIAMFGTSFMLSSVLMKRSNNMRGAMIVRWALIESAAVFGLLAAFIGHDNRLFLPLGALALAGMLVAYPRSASSRA